VATHRGCGGVLRSRSRGAVIEVVKGGLIIGLGVRASCTPRSSTSGEYELDEYMGRRSE